MSLNEIEFKEKLDAAHNFPGKYTFKFIVKPEFKTKVENLVEGAEVSLKPSSGNKYVSITLLAMMNSSQEVVDVYKEAKKIEGIISL